MPFHLNTLSAVRFRNFGGLVAAVIAITTCVPSACARDINVGLLRQYQTVSAGVAAAAAGDRLLLDAGVYLDDTAIVDKRLTIEGMGAGAILKITRNLTNQKGILIGGAALTVRNLTFEGAFNLDREGKNGAGIRMERGDLTIEKCTFLNNQDGILVNPIGGATVTITDSTFTGNGAGDGYSHGIYVNEVARLVVRDSTFSATKIGHSIKSRALQTEIVNVTIDDGVVGTSSYAIDIPNGGVTVIDNVRITQGVNSVNPAMIAYGAEGGIKSTSSLTVSNTTFVNRLSNKDVVAVNNYASGVQAVLTNNTYEGIPTVLKGGGNSAGGVTTGRVIRQGAIFSSAQTAAQSHLRFYNSGSTAGTVQVTLYDGATARELATWQSAAIPPNAAIQVPVATIEGAATAPFTKPAYYSVAIQTAMTGSFQHVLYRPADGTLSNLSACDSGIAMNAGKLANVHSSLLANGFPATVMIYNAGSSASTVTLTIYDATTGGALGNYTSGQIARGAQAAVSVASIERGAGIQPTGAQYHYTVRAGGGFNGVLQNLVENQSVGVVSDMTAVCTLGAG